MSDCPSEGIYPRSSKHRTYTPRGTRQTRVCAVRRACVAPYRATGSCRSFVFVWLPNFVGNARATRTWRRATREQPVRNCTHGDRRTSPRSEPHFSPRRSRGKRNHRVVRHRQRRRHTLYRAGAPLSWPFQWTCSPRHGNSAHAPTVNRRGSRRCLPAHDRRLLRFLADWT